MSEPAKAEQSDREPLERAIADLLDALDKQCFPNGSGPDARCNYSMRVVDSMARARSLLPRAPETEHKADGEDLARPVKRSRRPLKAREDGER